MDKVIGTIIDQVELKRVLFSTPVGNQLLSKKKEKLSKRKDPNSILS